MLYNYINILYLYNYIIIIIKIFKKWKLKNEIKKDIKSESSRWIFDILNFNKLR